MPSFLCEPSAFGMYARRTGGAVAARPDALQEVQKIGLQVHFVVRRCDAVDAGSTVFAGQPVSLHHPIQIDDVVERAQRRPSFRSRRIGYPLSVRGQVRGVQGPLPCFRSTALYSVTPPSLDRVPASPVPRLHQYYEGATTSRPREPGPLWFRFQAPRAPPVFVFAVALLTSPEEARQARNIWSAGVPIPGMAHPWARAGSHRFPGDPSHASALLLDPGRAGKISPWRSCRCCHRSTQTEGLSGHIISRLTQGFSIRCLRFTSDVTATHARLASGRRAAPLPGGRRTLWITSKGFRLHPFSFPGLLLSQGSGMPRNWRANAMLLVRLPLAKKP